MYLTISKINVPTAARLTISSDRTSVALNRSSIGLSTSILFTISKW